MSAGGSFFLTNRYGLNQTSRARVKNLKAGFKSIPLRGVDNFPKI